MITYLYWGGVVSIALIVFAISFKIKNIKLGVIISLVILAIAWSTYYFRLQQVFVKRYGGVMAIQVPQGMYHLGATWKDDNLWVENYDPESNTCVFSEYSRGNLLQGKVTIKNCNPLVPKK